MASITKKRIGGQVYYYARESQRVAGKPKIVWQKYLGKIDDIISAVELKARPTRPEHLIISQFGAVAALFDIAQRWGLVKTIDTIVEKRQQGLSVGQYMLIAALNRCVCPKSKRQIGSWFLSTPLRRLIAVPVRSLDSRRFWDNMQALDGDTIHRIENELTTDLVRIFGISFDCLLYDTTNFATFIDSFNHASTLAKRGKSKQGHDNLRIIGLALLVSRDFHIPLFHEPYAGNTYDAKEFESVVDRLVARCRLLTETLSDLTIVFDKGNNSHETMKRVDNSTLGFVGSLKLNQMEDDLLVPLSSYRSLAHPRLKSVKVLRLRREIFGRPRDVVLTYNQELFITQHQTIVREIKKRITLLKDYAAKLDQRVAGVIRKGKKPTVADVNRKVKAIVRGQYMKDIISTHVTLSGTLPVLSFTVDQDALNRLSQTRLGKTILFTSRENWSDEEIILAYRGQYHVEDAFKTMKNPCFVSWTPRWHWTDHNVRVHAFYCVIALTLASLLQRELANKGIKLSIVKVIEELSDIYEIAMSGKRGKEKGRSPKPFITISDMSPLQARLFSVLKLDRYTTMA